MNPRLRRVLQLWGFIALIAAGGALMGTRDAHGSGLLCLAGAVLLAIGIWGVRREARRSGLFDFTGSDD
ncbi:hypothetical protein AB0I28_32750 [Phytomonospora sp. NPDC050363]|uniref:hypothetical protein n=1 Tax=Phytomonospora sp. NPDC050363 TaxID=3155642 RepID=UPI0033D2D73C